MITSSVDVDSMSNDSNILVGNDNGEVLLVDFNIRNSHNEEMNKVEIVKKKWSVEPNQKILSIGLSPFFKDVFMVLTHLCFYIFDRNYDYPLFTSPLSPSPNSCSKWSISRYAL